MITMIILLIIVVMVTFYLISIKDNACWVFLAMLSIPIILFFVGTPSPPKGYNYQFDDNAIYFFQSYTQAGQCVTINDSYVVKINSWTPRELVKLDKPIIVNIPVGQQFKYIILEKPKQHIVEECK
jgi:hypothetical protein